MLALHNLNKGLFDFESAYVYVYTEGFWAVTNLHGPLGELARVIPQLVGEHGAALCVQLLPPLDPVGQLGVPLVQRLDREELRLVLGALHHGVVLTARHQHLKSKRLRLNCMKLNKCRETP